MAAIATKLQITLLVFSSISVVRKIEKNAYKWYNVEILDLIFL